ncbi:MAG TPA: hypothetical protein PLV92_23535, partial [Pirellulaceae bacterium]|nr:hypothetical protein [Pirellulaceae bacterium]
MTARLIGFMSVLLFLSLAAFGLIMNQSREAVLNEVRHTVSFVGSKTLAAFAGDLVADGPQQLDLRVTEAVDRRGPDAGGPATPADPPLSATTESPEVKEQ